MTDKISKEKRSEIMSHIHGKDTKPEIMVRKALHAMGYRYRKNDRRLPGSPDIHMPRYKVVIFVNGCFWHGHDECKRFKLPKTNTDYWLNKIAENKKRDEIKKKELVKMGYNVITLWECDILKDLNNCIEQKVTPFLVE